MKLAIIGSYGHVGFVLDSVAKLAGVQLAAAARWGEDDALAFVGRHPAAPAETPVYDDYRRLLDEAGPDVVGVFMPLYRLAEASIAAAQRGCHVISEKPLATTLADLARLRDAVRVAGVQLIAMFGMRATPAYQTARKAVADGRVGEPILAFAQKSYPFGRRDDFYRRRDTYGGSIPWIAIHALEFVSYCTGKDYARVAAMQSNEALADYPGCEDNGGVLLEFVGGGHAVITFDYLRPKAPGVERRHGDDRLRIVGTEGIVEVVEEGTEAILMTPTDVQRLPLEPARDFFAEFVASIRGEGDSLVTPRDSFRMTEVALKARQAADTGQIIRLT